MQGVPALDEMLEGYWSAYKEEQKFHVHVVHTIATKFSQNPKLWKCIQKNIPTYFIFYSWLWIEFANGTESVNTIGCLLSVLKRLSEFKRVTKIFSQILTQIFKLM